MPNKPPDGRSTSGSDIERDRVFQLLAGFEHRLDQHEGKLEALETVPAKLEDGERHMAQQDARLDKLDEGQLEIIRLVADNTAKTTTVAEDTREIVEIVKAFRGFAKVCRWIAGVITWVYKNLGVPLMVLAAAWSTWGIVDLLKAAMALLGKKT